jgi:hypothetical protein
MSTITCVKADKNADKEYFTVGKSYLILDYTENDGVVVADNDNTEHYLSGEYVKKYFK